MSTVPVTIVVVTYNSADTILDTLRGARACADAGIARTVVVDNVSRDETAALIASQHPWVKLIASGENLGFGRGNNLGFAEVDTPFVLFLNPDAVIEPEALSTLLDFMRAHPRCAMAAPAARMPEVGRFHMEGKLPTPWRVVLDSALPMLPHRDYVALLPGQPARQVEWLPGAAMLWPSALFRSLGGFDPRFFLYFEETDLMLRARQAGYELWAVCEAVIDHVGGGSTLKEGQSMFQECIAEHYFQSRLYYLAKHYGRGSAYLAEGTELLALTARSALQLLRGRRPPILSDRLKGPVFRQPPERR